MKKIIKIILIIVVVALVGIFIVFNFSAEKVENEENIIEPEEEISEEQARQTIVTLFFEDKTSMQLAKEERNVDAKELLNNPYKFIVELLIQGPKEENLKKIIPDGVKINKVNINGDIVTLDCSEEILNMSGTNAIYSIVNSLTELKEVNGVKFLINGEEKDGLKEIFVRK